jgi:hypothetical protein
MIKIIISSTFLLCCISISAQKPSTIAFYNVENLFDTIDGDYDDILKPVNGDWPMIVTNLMKKKVTLESVCILVELVGCMSKWEKQITEDILWPPIHRMIKKYTPFIEYDKDKFMKLLKEKIKNYDTA